MSEAAHSLLQRALQADSRSIVELLIDSAHRIDPTINAEAAKRQWLDQWMTKEYILIQAKTQGESNGK